MSKQKEDKTGSLLSHFESYLCELARNGKELDLPALALKWHSASPGTVVLEDATRRQYKLEEEQLDVLGSNIQLEGVEGIILRGLQFALKFQALATQEVEVVSSDYVLQFPGGQQKVVRHLPVVINLFPAQLKTEELSQESRGYLNRLAKRAHIARSEYVYGQRSNLLKFVPSSKIPLAQLADIQREQQQSKNRLSTMETEGSHYLEQLNSEGVSLMKRIQKMVGLGEVQSYMKSHEWKNPDAAGSLVRLLESVPEEQKKQKR